MRQTTIVAGSLAALLVYGAAIVLPTTVLSADRAQVRAAHGALSDSLDGLLKDGRKAKGKLTGEAAEQIDEVIETWESFDSDVGGMVGLIQDDDDDEEIDEVNCGDLAGTLGILEQLERDEAARAALGGLKRANGQAVAQCEALNRESAKAR